MSGCHDCDACTTLPPPSRKAKPLPSHVLALVGPPNSGKSTLFNRLTGLRQKVANFPGVTVEHRIGKAKVDRRPRRRAGRSARRLQPETAHGRRAGHPRRSDRPHDPASEARRGPADPRFHQPRPPPGAGRARSQPGPADAGDPEHGRRPAAPRRRSGYRRPIAAARRAGGSGQRHHGEGIEKVFQFLAGTAPAAPPPRR